MVTATQGRIRPGDSAELKPLFSPRAYVLVQSGRYRGELGRVNGMYHDKAVSVLFYQNCQYATAIIDTDYLVVIDETDLIDGNLPKWVDSKKVFSQYPKVKVGRE